MAILIVEDEAPILVLVESILQLAGYETLTAATLAEAQAVIHSDRPIDLIFTDVNLGEDHEGGLQVGQIVRQARPKRQSSIQAGAVLRDGMKGLFVEHESVSA